MKEETHSPVPNGLLRAGVARFTVTATGEYTVEHCLFISTRAQVRRSRISRSNSTPRG